MKKIVFMMLVLLPVLAFSQPASQSIGDLYNMSFGRYGFLNVDDTSTHTGKWGVFQADTTVVISQAVVKNYNSTTETWVNDTITNWTIPTGISKYWYIRKLKLSSGYGTLYNEKP